MASERHDLMAMCEREATHVSADATRGADYSDPDVMIGDLDGRHSTFVFGFTPRLPIYLILLHVANVWRCRGASEFMCDSILKVSSWLFNY